MNFTVDDADASFIYSPNGWAVQSQNDPDLDQFFQQTYHVAIQDQATMSFQFSGSAFTLYGSKGPDHASFEVQYDDTAVTVDASAQTTAFRQALFAHAFSAGGAVAQHLVKVTAALGGKNSWLDLDYITFTSGSGSTSSIGSATSAPPWLTDPSQTGQSATSPTGPSGFAVPSTSSSPSSSASDASSSAPSSSKAPTVLAALFGAILGLALLALVAWLFLRRALARRRARERAFRYGQSSVNPSVNPSASAFHNANHDPNASSLKGGYPPSAGAGSSPHESSAPMMMMMRTTTPSTAREGSFGAAEMRGTSMDDRERERERERERAGTPATALSALSGASRGLGLMSQSPIAWTTRRHRGDADSLRTDFLQV